MLFLFQKGEERCYSVAKSCPTLCDPMDCMGACQASLAFIVSWSLLKLMSIDSVMPSNHLILYHPLLLLPSVFLSFKIFSSELVLCIRWPEYWGFSFNMSEYSGLISFRIDWVDLLTIQELSRVFSFSPLFMVHLLHPYSTMDG